MDEIQRQNFFTRLEAAPYAVRGFFESIIEHFVKRNVVIVHYTGTNGGDLRLAVPGEMVGHHARRNFVTMYWQTRNQDVFARTILTPEECAQMGYQGATMPASKTEPLNSDLHLDETVWRYGTHDFIKTLEAAKFKMLAE